MTILILAAVLSTLVMQSPGAAPADHTPRGTCEIGGRVTDAETGRPIARAIVHLNRIGGSEPASARTDDQGRYRFNGLVPGEYSGLVNAGEFSAAYQIAPLAPGARGLVLADGDVRDRIDVALRRALGINVRVVNEWGQPLAGVGVSGQAVDGGPGVHASLRGTDDRGRLRLFRVPPGRYVICAEPLLPVVHANRATRERYLKTCYPSAASESDADVIVVERADTDIEIRMRRGRTFTISGTVLDASGAPAPRARMSLEIYQRNGSTGLGINVDAAGRFTIANVAPGDYALSAVLGGDDQPELRRDLERAFVPIHVDGADLDALRVSMIKTVNVAGRIVADSAAPPFKRQEGYGPIFVAARLADVGLPGSAGALHANAMDDRDFVLSGLFGRRILDVANVPRGWYVKSIRYRGDEILDVPVEFKAGTNPSELQVIVSTRGATISGRVVDERGEPVAKARLLLLPGDSSQWTIFHHITASSSEQGGFSLGPVRGGEYFVVALPRAANWPDPRDIATLKRLAERADRVTLADEEQRTMDLRIVTDGRQ